MIGAVARKLWQTAKVPLLVAHQRKPQARGPFVDCMTVPVGRAARTAKGPSMLPVSAITGPSALPQLDVLAGGLALALAIGLLVGLERGWRERDAPDGSRTAGIRTFGLAGLLGGLSAALAGATGSAAVLPAAFLSFALLFGAFKYREAVHDEEFSATSVIAALAVFTLGALAVAGDFRIAAAGGAVVAAVLTSRIAMHGLLRRMSWIELRSAILLGAMTMIGLSLLPNRALDPWGGFNPWEIWFLTVLTASISYTGYIAVRVMGPSRGLLVGGLAGGLASSTSTVAALGRAARDDGFPVKRAAAASLACLVSLIRVSALVAFLVPGVLATIAPAILPAMAVLGLTAGAILARGPEAASTDGPHGNPFDLLPLLVFSALLAGFSMLSAVLVAKVGDNSLKMTSAASGLIDVDVATLTALRLVEAGISTGLAGQAILVAVAVNAVVRVILALVLGPRSFGLTFGAATLAAASAGIAGLVIVSGGQGFW